MPLNILTFGRPSRKGRPTKEILEDLFNTKLWTIERLAEYYKVSQPCISKWLASYGIKKTSKARAKTIRLGVQRKYGVDNVMFVEKHRKTFMENLPDGVKTGEFIMKGSKYDQIYTGNPDFEFDGSKILKELGAQ